MSQWASKAGLVHSGMCSIHFLRENDVARVRSKQSGAFSTRLLKSNTIASTLVSLFVAAAAAFAHSAHAGAITVSDARVPATAATGGDVVMTMTITNSVGIADQLLRVRCPFANFAAKHTVDYGEGAPSMREVSAIQVPSGQSVTLSRLAYHVMLLQLREPLNEGQTFGCVVTFRGAGQQDILVRVAGTDD